MIFNAGIWLFIAITLLSTEASSAASIPQENAPQVENTSLSEGLRWSGYNAVALGTAIFVVSVGVSAVISLFLPLLAYKLCYLFGSCLDPLNLDTFRSVNINSRPKRSLEYVEPILTTLIQAYEQYADDGLKKKFDIPNF